MACVTLQELAAPVKIPTSWSPLYLNILLAQSAAACLVSLLFPVDASHLRFSSLPVPSGKLFSTVSTWLTASPSPNLVQIFACLTTLLKMDPLPFLLFPHPCNGSPFDIVYSWFCLLWLLFIVFLSLFTPSLHWNLNFKRAGVFIYILYCYNSRTRISFWGIMHTH